MTLHYESRAISFHFIEIRTVKFFKLNHCGNRVNWFIWCKPLHTKIYLRHDITITYMFCYYCSKLILLPLLCAPFTRWNFFCHIKMFSIVKKKRFFLLLSLLLVSNSNQKSTALRKEKAKLIFIALIFSVIDFRFVILFSVCIRFRCSEWC